MNKTQYMASISQFFSFQSYFKQGLINSSISVSVIIFFSLGASYLYRILLRSNYQFVFETKQEKREISTKIWQNIHISCLFYGRKLNYFLFNNRCRYMVLHIPNLSLGFKNVCYFRKR